MSQSPKPGNAVAMNCPRCAGRTQRKPAAGVVIHGCSNCGGVWFDDGELEKLRSRGAETQARAYNMQIAAVTGEIKFKPKLDCPRCDTPTLVRWDPPGIKGLYISRCEGCVGTWYDGGQLDDYLRMRKSEGVFATIKRLFQKN